MAGRIDSLQSIGRRWKEMHESMKTKKMEVGVMSNSRTHWEP